MAMDAPHDPHNGAAVMRSCDAFGVYRIHVVERTEAFSASGAVAKGTERWVDVVPHANVPSAVESLQQSGYVLVGTHPEGERTPDELASIPRLALVMGNEHDGDLRGARRGLSGARAGANARVRRESERERDRRHPPEPRHPEPPGRLASAHAAPALRPRARAVGPSRPGRAGRPAASTCSEFSVLVLPPPTRANTLKTREHVRFPGTFWHESRHRHRLAGHPGQERPPAPRGQARDSRRRVHRPSRARRASPLLPLVSRLPTSRRPRRRSPSPAPFRAATAAPTPRPPNRSRSPTRRRRPQAPR